MTFQAFLLQVTASAAACGVTVVFRERIASAVGVPEAARYFPGLALAGYTGRFAPNRIHVFGETEITYLNSLSAEERAVGYLNPQRGDYRMALLKELLR